MGEWRLFARTETYVRSDYCINYIYVTPKGMHNKTSISLHPCVALYEVRDQVCSHCSSDCGGLSSSCLFHFDIGPSVTVTHLSLLLPRNTCITQRSSTLVTTSRWCLWFAANTFIHCKYFSWKWQLTKPNGLLQLHLLQSVIDTSS